MKQRVLFICVHNSARSQIAEAFLDKICGDQFEAHSAGLEPGRLNPLAVEAMREIGIDISQNQTQSVFDVFKSGELFPTWSQSATKVAPSAARFFQAWPSDCTGVFQIRLRSPAHA